MAASRLIIIPAIILFLVYGFAIFFLNLSYSTFVIFHLIFAVVIVAIISKIAGSQESSLLFGFKLSLIVGILLLIANLALYYLGDKINVPQLEFLSNVPNPIIYFVIFMVIFNVPFLLNSTLSMGKTIFFSVILMAIVILIPIIISISQGSCTSYSCNINGCFCKHTISSQECPDCSAFCTDLGKNSISAKDSINIFPDFKALYNQYIKSAAQCTCYCK